MLDATSPLLKVDDDQYSCESDQYCGEGSSMPSSSREFNDHDDGDPLTERAMLTVERSRCQELARLLRELHPNDATVRTRPIGLALSGGGTRCASFHCGVLWALASAGLMKDVAHLSATSGGGYTAASLMTHLYQMAGDAEGAPSLDEWYKTVVMRTVLRMQHNINYLMESRPGYCCHRRRQDNIEDQGTSSLPRFLDCPVMIGALVVAAVLSPILLLIHLTWPLVLIIETHFGNMLRSVWCDPSNTPEMNPFLRKWFINQIFFIAMWVFVAFFLRYFFDYTKDGQKAHPTRYLFSRATRQLVERGLLLYGVFTLLVLWVLWLQVFNWGVAASPTHHDKHIPEFMLVRHLCQRYVTTAHLLSQNPSLQLRDFPVAPACSDAKPDGPMWFEVGGNAVYMNATWSAIHAQSPNASITPGQPLPFDRSLLILLTGEVTSLGATGLLALGAIAAVLGSKLLKWLVTIVGPAFVFYVICSVARWHIFGPITEQELLGNGTRYSRPLAQHTIWICVTVAIFTLPIYDAVQKLSHLVYRRALKQAFFCKGKDVSGAAMVTCPYCPNLLLGACLHDYRPPGEDSNFCDFSISSYFVGSSRTGYYYTPTQARLAHLITVIGAGPDAALLVNVDILLIRFLLSVLSLRFGDFLRLQPEGQTAVRLAKKIDKKMKDAGTKYFEKGSGKRVRIVERLQRFLESRHNQHFIRRWLQGLLDRLPAAVPFFVCHLLLLCGTIEATRRQCWTANFLLNTSFSGFVLVLAFSFFAFLPCLNWMMRSPMIQQFQMMVMHRYKAEKAPPYVYLSDGGLLEVLNLLPLLRRRMEHMVVSDAAEDQALVMRCLRETSTIARQEGLCSFYDPRDPRRDLEFVWQDFVKEGQSFLHLCVRYERRYDSDGKPFPSSLDDVEIGHVYYIRMRGNPSDQSHVRTELSENDLLKPPITAAQAPAAPGQGLRRDMSGACCEWVECGGRCVGRRFPDFSHHNQFLNPLHFANLCTLGAELAAPAMSILQGSSPTKV